MASSSQTVAVEVAELLGSDHWRLDVSLTTNTTEGEVVNAAIDEASPANIRAMVDKARDLIDRERKSIERLARMLAQPKAPAEPKDRLPAKGIMAPGPAA